MLDGKPENGSGVEIGLFSQSDSVDVDNFEVMILLDMLVITEMLKSLQW